MLSLLLFFFKKLIDFVHFCGFCTGRKLFYRESRSVLYVFFLQNAPIFAPKKMHETRVQLCEKYFYRTLAYEMGENFVRSNFLSSPHYIVIF